MTPTDDRVKEGVEHLQAAALELIAAARVFLDIAEDAVKDPSDLVALASAAAAQAKKAAERANPSHDGHQSHRHDDGVERIRVV